MILFTLELFSGCFLGFIILNLFVGRRRPPDDTYYPDVDRDVDDDWEL